MGILVFVIRILFTFCKLYRYLKGKHNYEFKRIGKFVGVQVALIGCWTLALALNLAANWPFHGFSESDEKWDEAIQIDYCPKNLDESDLYNSTFNILRTTAMSINYYLLVIPSSICLILVRFKSSQDIL